MEFNGHSFLLLLEKKDSLVALASIIGDSVIFVPYPSNSCFVLNLESQFLQFLEFI